MFIFLDWKQPSALKTVSNPPWENLPILRKSTTLSDPLPAGGVPPWGTGAVGRLFPGFRRMGPLGAWRVTVSQTVMESRPLVPAIQSWF